MTMDMNLAKPANLKKVADCVYDCGWGGSAVLKVKFIQEVPESLVEKVRAAIRVKMEEYLAKYAAMPKSQFNKETICDFIYVYFKANETDEYATKFEVCTSDIAYTTTYVRGRKIKTLRTIDEIMEKMVVEAVDAGADTWRGYEHYTAFRKVDGKYYLTKYGRIDQKGLDYLPSKHCGRGKFRASFRELVLAKVAKITGAGYTLVATRANIYDREYDGESTCLVFTK